MNSPDSFFNGSELKNGRNHFLCYQQAEGTQYACQHEYQKDNHKTLKWRHPKEPRCRGFRIKRRKIICLNGVFPVGLV